MGNLNLDFAADFGKVWLAGRGNLPGMADNDDWESAWDSGVYSLSSSSFEL